MINDGVNILSIFPSLRQDADANIVHSPVAKHVVGVTTNDPSTTLITGKPLGFAEVNCIAAITPVTAIPSLVSVFISFFYTIARSVGNSLPVVPNAGKYTA